MRGERIEALSVMYAFGVASGAALCAVFPGPWTPVSAVSAGFFLFLLMTMATRPRDIRLILGIYLAAGMFCFCTANAGKLWSEGTMDPLTEAATSSAEAAKGVIDAIPYNDPQTNALVKALITGDRSGISRGTTAVFRESGASHILALSGMHLGIIYMVLLWIMVPLGNAPAARKVRCFATIAVTLFYSVATGFSPSITRAFLFIAINEILKLTGRKKGPVRVFCIALFMQLVMDPLVISSVGFQLSYLAMCGITLLYPRLFAWYPHDRMRNGKTVLDLPGKIWQGAALSISCQVFTAPLVWIRFHSFPTYFLMTNLLAMPITSVVMILSVLTVTLSAMGCCPDLLVAADERTVSALRWVLTVISEM